jgi:NADH:ubiquinone reductase (H+-translocating)
MTARHQVVIVGGGFGGLAAAKAAPRARRRPDRRPAGAPPLPAAALPRGDGDPLGGNVAPPIRDVLRRHDNAHVVLDDVVEIDLERKAVTCSLLDRTWDIGYDTLASPPWFKLASAP